MPKSGPLARHRAGSPWRNRREFHTGHRRQRLHRLGAGQGAGERRPRRAGVRRQFARRAAPAGEVEGDIEFIGGDIRDAAAVARAVRGVDEVHHLAFVNGTEFFYSAPELVLDVGVKGMINVIDACRGEGVGKLILASSSEVYQTPPHVPTDETRAAAGARPDQSALFLRRRQDHQRADGDQLRPQILRSRADLPAAQRLRTRHGLGTRDSAVRTRLKAVAAKHPTGKLPFEMQGNGQQTRSFCHVDDLVAGVLVMRDKGEHLGIYHVGTTEEITIADLATRVAAHGGREIELIATPAPAGGTERRCPDIAKLAKLGYKPKLSLAQGLPPTIDWYWANENLAPQS